MQQRKILLNRKINKKAQEEMVGFVLIMLLVAVIFLVFLGIFIRKKPAERDQNAEISQFLDAAVDYTSDCTIDGYHYLNLAELIAKCDERARCNSNEETCEVLRSSLKGLVEVSWTFGPESPNKGYIVEVSRETTRVLVPPVLPSPNARPGGCSSHTGAEKPIFTNAGAVTLSLQICLT